MVTNGYLNNWQTVILRNYGIVPNKNIAKVLKCSVETVEENAKKLGIGDFAVSGDWIAKGFVTIIRANWDLLCLNDIAVLLNSDVQSLKKLLVEYDFLDVKLGEQPSLDSPLFTPLSEEEEKRTAKAREIIIKNKVTTKAKPFAFFDDFVEPVYFGNNGSAPKDRFLSSYSARYSGALLDDELSDYNEDYLKKLALTGTNGIWLSDTLRNLADFPFDSSLSPDYKIRIKNLKKLTERCRKFGINVYLYMNEPRALPESFFEKYPDMKGQRADDGTYCLCTSNKKVRDYLYTAFRSIAENCPLLKGIMTITMSENPTHCYSRYWENFDKIQTDCPVCKNIKPQVIVSDINNIIARALRDGNGYTKLISNIWGWKNYSGSDNKEVFETIDLLDKDIEVLCVSEYGKEFIRGGVKCAVDDYSVSVVGPSEFAKEVLSYAKSKGHRIWAKVQMNNSWECSAVPYIPVFDLMEEHIRNLQKLNIDGLMLGWSLGGYPGGVLPLVNSIFDDGNFDSQTWYEKTYGENANVVRKAVAVFSEAYRNYPFSVDVIYFGGHTSGPANMWSKESRKRKSTMVCFTFDDYENYVKPYGIEVYTTLLERVCSGFYEGLKLIENLSGNKAFEELKNCATVSFIHFKSALNLAKFSYFTENNRDTDELISSEEELTKKLIKIIAVDNKIAFEMTNHYYYTQNILLEKLLNLSYCK